LPIKSYLEDHLYGRRHSFLINALLSALSLVYRSVVCIRNNLYHAGLFPGKKLGCKVVSVGNVTIGGTGKTPTVISLARFLASQGRRPLVVSRGYGRQDESKVVVVSDGDQLLTDARTGGDEPVLIGSKLRGVPVVTGADRYEAADYGIRRFKSDIVVLDDGFQHRRLHRNLDIVLIDATDPFGNDRIFPAGILREPVRSLRRAHAVVITKADQSLSLETLKERIRQATASRIFTSFQRPVDLIDGNGIETKSLSSLRGARVLAFSGIARPASFVSMLKALGANVVAEFVYPDHHRYGKNDLAALFRKAADERVSLIITTEKDAVRLRSLKPEGIWSLRIDLTIVEQEEWESFILGII
jgi:tetraacyldisaccharide 4'-kinase